MAEPEGDSLDFVQSRFQPFVQVMSLHLECPSLYYPRSFHFVLREPLLWSRTYDPLTFTCPPHLALRSHVSPKSSPLFDFPVMELPDQRGEAGNKQEIKQIRSFQTMISSTKDINMRFGGRFQGQGHVTEKVPGQEPGKGSPSREKARAKP